MTDLLDFVALSLLPFWCRLRTAERLRAGDSPAAVLRRLLTDHWSDEPDRATALGARAEAAIGRAQANGISAVTWSDAAYPVALTTIADPPPLLWTRGQVDALSMASIWPPGTAQEHPI